MHAGIPCRNSIRSHHGGAILLGIGSPSLAHKHSNTEKCCVDYEHGWSGPVVIADAKENVKRCRASAAPQNRACEIAILQTDACTWRKQSCVLDLRTERLGTRDASVSSVLLLKFGRWSNIIPMICSHVLVPDAEPWTEPCVYF
jgi:hypothetical protein